MTDPAIQFAFIGSDSPEVQDEIKAAFARLRAAFQELAEQCAEMRAAIIEAFKPLVQIILSWYRDLCLLHLMPRQYRNTMQRRKLRRLLR